MVTIDFVNKLSAVSYQAPVFWPWRGAVKLTIQQIEVAGGERKAQWYRRLNPEYPLRRVWD
jgi:hypothetical protein